MKITFRQVTMDVKEINIKVSFNFLHGMLCGIAWLFVTDVASFVSRWKPCVLLFCWFLRIDAFCILSVQFVSRFSLWSLKIIYCVCLIRFHIAQSCAELEGHNANNVMVIEFVSQRKQTKTFWGIYLMHFFGPLAHVYMQQ